MKEKITIFKSPLWRSVCPYIFKFIFCLTVVTDFYLPDEQREKVILKGEVMF